LLVVVSTQIPAHSVSPVGHSQEPSVQLVPPVQKLPQAPQWALFDRMSVQTPPHSDSPAPHVQAPCSQMLSPGHCSPQAPQCRL
jgi:hypothetical protein